jgi:glycerol-3-phosphate acyltransferase PlsY
MTNFILILIAGYVIGSLSSAYLVTRLVAGIDLRRFGTGSIGTSNMYQATRRKSLIPLVAAWDIGKGWLPLYFGVLAGLSLWQAVVVALVTVIGHNWPFYLGFKGGRGMMTTLGISFALPVLYGYNPPWPIIAGFSLFLTFSAILRGTPLGVFIGVLAIPVVSLALGDPPALSYGYLCLFLLMLVRRLALRRHALSVDTPLWKVLLARFFLDRDILDRNAWVNGTKQPAKENAASK